MNRFMSRINIRSNMGRHGLSGHLLAISSGNVLGALFLWLPMGRKDKSFGGGVIYMTNVIIHV